MNHPYVVTQSTSKNPQKIIADLTKELPSNCKGGLIYMDYNLEHEVVLKGMANCLNKKGEIIGCTTSGEISNASAQEGGSVFLGFCGNDFSLFYRNETGSKDPPYQRAPDDALLPRCKDRGDKDGTPRDDSCGRQ